MKKVILVYVVLIIAFVLLAIFGFGRELPFISNFISNGNSTSNPSATAIIGGAEFELQVADDDDERIRGLSGAENLPENQGMLFVFEEHGDYGFWMKEMNFPIDIIFIDDETVVNVVKNAQPVQDAANLTIYTPEKDVNRVLELNAGKADELGIESGTTITFEGL